MPGGSLINDASSQEKISSGEPKEAHFANYFPGKKQHTDSGYFRLGGKQKISTMVAESSIYDSPGYQHIPYSDVLKTGAIGRADKGNANTYTNCYMKKPPSPLTDLDRSKPGHKPTLTV